MAMYQITARVVADREITQDEMDELHLELAAILSERDKSVDDPWKTMSLAIEIHKV